MRKILCRNCNNVFEESRDIKIEESQCPNCGEKILKYCPIVNKLCSKNHINCTEDSKKDCVILSKIKSESSDFILLGKWHQSKSDDWKNPKIFEESIGEWTIDNEDENSDITGFGLFLFENIFDGIPLYVIELGNRMLGDFHIKDCYTEREAINTIKEFTDKYDTWNKFVKYLVKEHGVDSKNFNNSDKNMTNYSEAIQKITDDLQSLKAYSLTQTKSIFHSFLDDLIKKYQKTNKKIRTNIINKLSLIEKDIKYLLKEQTDEQLFLIFEIGNKIKNIAQEELNKR